MWHCSRIPGIAVIDAISPDVNRTFANRRGGDTGSRRS